MRILGVCTGYYASRLKEKGFDVRIGLLQLEGAKDVIVFDVIGNLIGADIPVIDVVPAIPGVWRAVEETPVPDFTKGVTKVGRYHQSREPREFINLESLPFTHERRVSKLKTPNWKTTG